MLHSVHQALRSCWACGRRACIPIHYLPFIGLLSPHWLAFLLVGTFVKGCIWHGLSAVSYAFLSLWLEHLLPSSFFPRPISWHNSWNSFHLSTMPEVPISQSLSATHRPPLVPAASHPAPLQGGARGVGRTCTSTVRLHGFPTFFLKGPGLLFS